MLDLAEKNVADALTTGRIELESQDETSLLAYPAALMLLALAGDERVQRRYAVCESKRVYELMKQESPDLLLRIAEHTFGWNAKVVDKEVGETSYEFAVAYPDYLRNASWKLTNRVLEQGFVYCHKDEFARLLEEEVEAHVLSRIMGDHGAVPEAIAQRVERTRSLVAACAQRYSVKEMPKTVVLAAMPPCARCL